jgi:phosphatidylserine synthase
LRQYNESKSKHIMNMLLWILQVFAAVIYGASGFIKLFRFEKVSKDVPSFGALPRNGWTALGMLELVCAVWLVAPAAFLHWNPMLTVTAATLLALESLVVARIHAKYRESTSVIVSFMLALVMAFIAYGRAYLRPIL